VAELAMTADKYVFSLFIGVEVDHRSITEDSDKLLGMRNFLAIGSKDLIVFFALSFFLKKKAPGRRLSTHNQL